MSSSIPPPEKRFLENVVGLISLTGDVISDAEKAGITVPVQPWMLTVAGSFVSNKNPHDVINTFLVRSFPHWGMIKARNVEFFRSATETLFDGVSAENIAAFVAFYDTKKPDGTKLFDTELETLYFNYFGSMIKQCICYIHQQRKPDPVTKKYTVAAYSDIGGIKVSVSELVKEWNVTNLN